MTTIFGNSTIASAGDTHPMRDHILSVLYRGVHDFHRARDQVFTVEDVAEPCDRCAAMKLADAPERPRSKAWDGWTEVVDAAFTHQIAEWVDEFGEGWMVRRDLQVMSIGGEGGPEVGGARGFYRPSDGLVVNVIGYSGRDLKHAIGAGMGAGVALAAQVHGYAWQHAGFKVANVATLALPRDGYLKDSVLQQWTYEPNVALAALSRYVSLAESDDPDRVVVLRGCPRCPPRRAEGSVVDIDDLDPGESVVGYAHAISADPASIASNRVSCAVRDDMLALIERCIHGRPRSQQKRIGPSEIGDPCTRCLARKVSGQEEPRGDDPWEDGWKAEVGTSIHALCEYFFTRYGGLGWHLEERVTVPPIGGALIQGTCDAYNESSQAVVDFKTTGSSGLDKRRKVGHSTVYKKQGHIYGLGWAVRGFPVLTVGFFSIPRDGVLAQSVYEEFLFSARAANESIARADELARISASFESPEVREGWLLTLDTDEDCFSCGRYDPRMKKSSGSWQKGQR